MQRNSWDVGVLNFENESVTKMYGSMVLELCVSNFQIKSVT